MHLKQTGELSLWVHAWIIFDYQCYSTHRRYFFLALIHKTTPHYSVYIFKNAIGKNIYVCGFSRPISSLQSTIGLIAIRLRLRAPVFTLQKHIQLAWHFKGIVQPKMICLVSRNVYKPVLGSEGKHLTQQDKNCCRDLSVHLG